MKIKDVPDTWIFETYLELNEQLYGQEVTIRSPFGGVDSRPSFTLFYEKNRKYLFRDFSYGAGGDGVTLVSHLFKISLGDAIKKITEDYESFLQGNGTPTSRDMKIIPKYRVSGHQLRNWNSDDRDYWRGQYLISAKSLEALNVAALQHFTMSKTIDGVDKTILIKRRLLYGFFTNRGELYKIYQPENPDCKFIRVMTHIQGRDQLQFKSDTLLIVKAMKEIAALKSWKVTDWEMVAPDSENDLLPKTFIADMKTRYKNIYCMMDNDKAGREAALKYQKAYDIPEREFNMGHKDPTDTMKALGPDAVVPALKALLR